MAEWPDGLPMLLAGPIVRRVEPGLAAVWVAVRQQCTVRLTLYEGMVNAGTDEGVFDGGEPLASGERDTRRVGEQLHLAVVTVETEALRPGTIYSYNLDLHIDGERHDLRTLGLLADRTEGTQLGYAAGELPSFALPPPELTDLRLVHASCRCIDDHNDPGPDALPWLDDLIRRDRADPLRRPHQLYLTGDQIYADHVGISVLPMVTRLGNELLGAVEHIPLREGHWPADLHHLPSGWRDHPLTGSGLTGDANESHLLSLAEYCAMYLLAFSPEVWPDASGLPPGIDRTELARLPDPDLDPTLRAQLLGVAESSLPHLSENDPCEIDTTGLPAQARNDIAQVCSELVTRRKQLGREPPLIARFHAGLAPVRRALANVPVYMIFDDHEVTDDWNMTHRWVRQVTGSALGRTILRNGLLAYAGFQAEGNDPARFASTGTPEGLLLAHLGAVVPADGGPPVPEEVARIDSLLGLAPGSQPQLRWDYQVPGPRHRTVVLDTRTRRRFSGEITPAALISPEHIDAQIPGSSPAGTEVLVVVSAAPVLGLPVIETFGGSILAGTLDAVHAYGWRDRPGWAKPDREAWSHEPVAFEALLRRLAPHRRVVFLSGDVHYAMGATMSYWRSGPEPTRFVQLTSSGACQAWPKQVITAVRALTLAQRILTSASPVEQLGWRSAEPEPVEVPAGEFLTPALRFRLDQSPVLIPTHGWPEQTFDRRPPDFRWRTGILSDPRPAEELPEAARPIPLEGDVSPAEGLDAYHEVAQRHADGLATVTHGPQVLWLHNIGIVTFTQDEEGLAVRHDLLSRHPNGSPPEAPDIYTSHRARLDDTVPPEPPPRLPGSRS